jgi:hypothetical protein
MKYIILFSLLLLQGCATMQSIQQACKDKCESIGDKYVCVRKVPMINFKGEVDPSYQCICENSQSWL